MKRYILINEMQLDALKIDYINYPNYFYTLDEAIKAAEETKSRCWIMKTFDYLNHILNKTEAQILWCTTK